MTDERPTTEQSPVSPRAGRRVAVPRGARPTAVALVVVLAAVAMAVARAGHGARARASACPAGYVVARGDGPIERAAARRRACLRSTHPESNADLAAFSEHAAMRAGGDRPGAVRAALARRARLAAGGPNVAGTGGSWTPLGKGPLLANDPAYPDTYGDSFAKLSGRISDYTYDANDRRVYAAVAQGGVWASDDVGQHWYSVGDGLPVQSVGSVGWTPAGGGTLLVVTGDNAFSNDYAGMGVYWSTDGGQRWRHATGVPDGALGFRIAIDPTNPSVVYAATGVGLYRSADAGRSFTNVNLPTGDCAGDSFKPSCFFANEVTDVAVQATDQLGHRGGAVVAAVGWRAGQYPNFAGKPQAPANGLYRSDSGVPGSFAKVPDSAGFTPTDKAGRVALGAATGAKQDSSYLYAVSQDAKEFTSGREADNDVPGVQSPIGFPPDPLAAATNLDGIYVSPDFGRTWKLMENGQQMENPANGSSLNQVRPLGIAAGYQATYNEWIKPDPTQQDASGVPTRLVFGLEEVWQSAVPGQPQSGPSQFQVFGAYNGGGPCLLVLATPACSAKQGVAQTTTTHPDQHGDLLLPDGKGGVTLLAGNDGGNYVQHSSDPQSDPFAQGKWGDGAQDGLHTLLPYGVAAARDGTIYAGLQDNGEAKLSPNGTQNMVFGGDGFFTLTDPANSNVAYEELPNAGVNVTTDGGHTWTDINPLLTDSDFVAPLVMDPTDAKHIISAGRQIAETTAGPNTTNANGTCNTADPAAGCADTDWALAYDLGTFKHPGDAKAVAAPDDPANIAFATALQGANAYVGFCGSCDPVKLHQRFHSGLATNVAGPKPPKARTQDGWHIASAKGLPQRIITSAAIDPADPRTVYVTLGASAARYFAPLGSLGEESASSAGGFVYESTDAGETFKDITGDLPRLQATWVMVHGSQLLVADEIGVFASAGRDGGHYQPLGDNLPTAAVYQMVPSPQDPNVLIAASYGRGVYSYRFADRSASAPPPPGVRGPAACASTAGFTRATARAAGRGGVRFDFAPRAANPVSVDVFGESAGRRVLPERLVARFVGQRRAFTWDGVANQPGRRIADGIYFARYTVRAPSGRPDVRRVTLQRSHGRFALRPPFYARADCRVLAAFKLLRPVFGGSTRAALGISFQLARAGRATLTITHAGRVVRRYVNARAVTRRTYRLTLPARRLARGDYRATLTVAGAAGRITSTLTARDL